MSKPCGICGASGERIYRGQDDCPGFLGCAKVKEEIQRAATPVQRETEER
jgi:hypothetical protein